MLTKLIFSFIVLATLLTTSLISAQELPVVPSPTTPPAIGFGTPEEERSNTSQSSGRAIFVPTAGGIESSSSLSQTTAVRSGGLSIIVLLLIPAITLFLYYYYKVKENSSPLATVEKRINKAKK